MIAGPAIAESRVLLEFDATDTHFAVGLDALEMAIDQTDDARLFYRLPEEMRSAFAAFTKSALQQRVVVSACGASLGESVVQAVIESGVGLLVLENPAHAETLHSMARGDAGCAALLND